MAQTTRVDLGVLARLHPPHHEGNDLQLVALGVLRQALDDLGAPLPEPQVKYLHRFLLDPTHSALRAWCDVAQVLPEAVTAEARRRLTGTPTRQK